MLFIATCVDKPDSLAKRMETARRISPISPRSARSVQRRRRAARSGRRRTPIGSLLIFETVDEAEVRALLAADPYAEAGLFASVDLKPWRQALGVTIAR